MCFNRHFVGENNDNTLYRRNVIRELAARRERDSEQKIHNEICKETAMGESTTLESNFEKLAISSSDKDQAKGAAAAVTGSDDASKPITFSKEELDAMYKVHNALIETHNIEHHRIGMKTLALTTIVSKLRVDEAAEKYAKYLQMVKECGVPSLNDDIVLTLPGGYDQAKLSKRLSEAYAACGKDVQGRSVMWIKGTKEAIPVEEETEVVLGGILYHLAIHADNVSLRQGITFVVDTSSKPAKRAKNDAKLQKTWQAMPMRPQALLIAGASLPLRVLINSLILVASLFTKQKILDRIKFVKVSDALKSIPDQNAQPQYLGGGGGGIQDIGEWTMQRIENFPTPDL